MKIKIKYLDSRWITTKGIKKSSKKKQRLHSKLKKKKKKGMKKRKKNIKITKGFLNLLRSSHKNCIF